MRRSVRLLLGTIAASAMGGIAANFLRLIATHAPPEDFARAGWAFLVTIIVLLIIVAIVYVAEQIRLSRGNYTLEDFEETLQEDKELPIQSEESLVPNVISTEELFERMRQRAGASGDYVDRWIYVQSQLMRIRILIDEAANVWVLEGKPSDEPVEGDEIVPTQLELLSIYRQYGLWGEIGLIERTMGFIERHIGKTINSRRERKHWLRSSQM